MSKLRVAVIGCGSIAKHRHIPELEGNPNVELVAFCDIVVERAQTHAQKHGGKAYTDYHTLLKEVQPDAVFVCTPNALHAPVSIAAASAGAHVLVEKPMAISDEEGKAMIAAARKTGVTLMVGHNQRFMPPHVKAKEILKSGRLGKVLSFRTSFGHPGPESWSADGANSWFFRKNEAFVGAMGDLGVHKADLIRWMLEDEVSEIGAMVDTLHKKGADVDDNAVCVLRMSKGTIGSLVASWTYYKGEDNSTILWCEHGVLKIGTDHDYHVIVELTNGTVERYSVGEMATNQKQTVSGVADEFIDSILEKRNCAVPGEEGLKSLNVILAAIESQRTKTFVSLG